MDQKNLYRDIAGRCEGDIYIGVVGPVRTGKSTFIKRFMELLVLPNIENADRRARVQDELPVSGAGRTITTTEPKFVPRLRSACGWWTAWAIWPTARWG